MTGTPYRRGAYFERRVKRELELHGYLVIRSAGSHGLVDLVALSPNYVMLIQCRADGELDPATRSALLKLDTGRCGIVMLAYRQGRGICVRQICDKKGEQP